MSERSHGDASDIDGKTARSTSAGAHESTWEANEFQTAPTGFPRDPLEFFRLGPSDR